MKSSLDAHEHARPTEHASAILCAFALFVGTVKGIPLLAWVPVDLTLATSCLLALALTLHLLRSGGGTRVSLPALLLVATLVPPALARESTGYQSEKVQGMVITLLFVAASAYLIGTSRRRRLWIRYLTIAGLLTAAGLVVLPSDPSQYGRAVFEGSNTISTSRLSGVAVVLLMTTALMPGRRAWRIAAAVLGLAAAGAMLATGSRGPLVAVVIVLLVLVIRVGGRGRLFRVCAVASLFAAGWVFLTTDGSAGTDRIEATLSGEASGTATRQPLWDAAVRALTTYPQSVTGTGWGGFVSVMRPGELLPTGDRQYAHDVILEAIVEGGWLAGGAITAFIVLSVVRAWKAGSDPQVVPILALVVFALANASISGDFNDNRLLWVAAALCWTLPGAQIASRPTPGDPIIRKENDTANRLFAPVLPHA